MLYKRYLVSLKQNFGIQGHNMREKFELHTRYCSTMLCQRSAKNMGIKLFNKFELHTRYCSTMLCQRSATNMGIKFYDRLPVQINNCTVIEFLRQKGNTFLLNNSFYMAEEFFAL